MVRALVLKTERAGIGVEGFFHAFLGEKVDAAGANVVMPRLFSSQASNILCLSYLKLQDIVAATNTNRTVDQRLYDGSPDPRHSRSGWLVGSRGGGQDTASRQDRCPFR